MLVSTRSEFIMLVSAHSEFIMLVSARSEFIMMVSARSSRASGIVAYNPRPAFTASCRYAWPLPRSSPPPLVVSNPFCAGAVLPVTRAAAAGHQEGSCASLSLRTTLLVPHVPTRSSCAPAAASPRPGTSCPSGSSSRAVGAQSADTTGTLPMLPLNVRCCRRGDLGDATRSKGHSVFIGRFSPTPCALG